MKELQPINQLVVLDITETKNEQRTSSGIIIPDTAKEKPLTAPVVWMGVVENAEIKPGDVVLYKPFTGTETDLRAQLSDNAYADVLAKVVETEMI